MTVRADQFVSVVFNIKHAMHEMHAQQPNCNGISIK